MSWTTQGQWVKPAEKCYFCGQPAKDSDPDVEEPRVDGNPVYAHKVCLERGYSASLEEKLKASKARVRELEACFVNGAIITTYSKIQKLMREATSDEL